MELERMLKVADIQKHLGISRKKAYELVLLKGFPKITIGRGYFIPEDQYKKWINENVKNKIIL